MSFDHVLNTYLKVKYEDPICIGCEKEDAYDGEEYCYDCLMQRARDSAEDMRDSYD